MGGKVHLILGNHELIVFNDDLRYITDEYYSLCENLGIDYSDLYDEHSVLGHWLRQKPVMMQINDFIFLHGGVSPELLEKELNIDKINNIVWQYLNNMEHEEDNEYRQFLLGSKGVLWYRGMAPNNLRKDVIDENTLDRVLEFYNARAIVIGHSEVDSISSYFGKKVINVNVPKRKKEIKDQGLLIDGDQLWIVTDSPEIKEF